MLLHEYIPSALLKQMVDDGYVRVQTSGYLDIYNYTEKAQYERVWNEATRKCRGLIVDRGNSGWVIARPFEKFFNYGEAERPMTVGGSIRVQEKMDGSLGILYFDPYHEELRIATRGSFASDQAQWATRWLHETFPEFMPLVGFTYLFEIIYPENRIVLDYGDKRGLVLLDVLNNETGLSALKGCRDDWPGEVVTSYPYESLEEVVAVPDRANAEGFVVYFERDGQRVKVKHEEYVRLHRIVTGLNTKAIWEILSEGGNVDHLMEAVPDEMFTWVREQVATFQAEFARISSVTWVNFLEWNRLACLVAGPSGTREHRKEFAGLIQQSAYKDIMFGYLDDKDISPMVWKRLKPKHTKPFWGTVEVAA